MKICVLQPDYTGSSVDYGNYDPRRNLSAWLPADTTEHLFLRKATTYRQLLEASKLGYDIFINLCEGYMEWDIPGIDVVWALEELNLPYTGPSPRLFLPAKTTMKIVAHTVGVATPAWCVISGLNQIPAATRYPLFVKPDESGDSLGIDQHSLVHNLDELRAKCAALLPEFPCILVEEYIGGREFTVLVAADPGNPDKVLTLTPFEFVFDPGVHFKTYHMKVAEHHPQNNIPVADPELAERLRGMAAAIFRGFESQSYARVDMRANEAGELFFLDINCGCSIFYPEGSEGSADYILKHDPMGHTGFLRHVIAEGIARHRRRRKRFTVRTSPGGGLGCFALEDFAEGEIVLPGEATTHRLTTAEADPRTIPAPPALAGGPRLIRDADPGNWAPLRTGDPANVAWRGLDLVARRPIAKGEELAP
ncbi:MAG: hypothetical protein NTY38_24335 [Acidobacteria bacterium]|nr:hypothetical protein [Acidobacteriota bacterium]